MKRLTISFINMLEFAILGAARSRINARSQYRRVMSGANDPTKRPRYQAAPQKPEVRTRKGAH